MAGTNWRIAGEYFETCNCDYLCPCIYTNMQAQPTHDTCIAAIVMRINDGTFGDTDLGGVAFIIAISVDGPMAGGNWTVGLIIDDKASDAQVDAVGQICSGDFGGPMEMGAALVGNFAGIERAAIEIDKQEMSFSVKAGALFENAAEATPSMADPNVPIHIDNTGHPVNARLALATGTESHMHVFGINWDDAEGGHNGHFAPFDWSPA
ncbi:MAG: DUF1326 domain-containing protein [Alphaproteobacteria bacterium]